MKIWKKSVLCSALAGGLVAGGLVGPVVAAPNPPQPVEGEQRINCDEGLLVITYAGKAKTVENASGVKYLSPGLKATVTNEAGESFTYTVTGTVRPDPAVNGEVRVEATGRNILTAATAANPTEAFLTSGNVTFVVDLAGNEIERFSGPGKVVDLCEELA